MFNNSTTMTECSASAVDSDFAKVVKYVIYSMIMIVATLGNMFIITVVYKKKTMRRTTNIFIANMALSDMLIAVIVVPRMIVELYVGPRRWLIDGSLGSLTCKFTNFFADFSLCITITSHAVIAVDRFWAIVYCLRPSPVTPTRRKYIIAIIWLYSFLLHSPNLYIYKLRYIKGKAFCRINWHPLDNFTSQRTFFSFILVFVICIPGFLMSVLYIWLIVSLNKTIIHHPHVRQQRQKEDVVVLRKIAVLLSVFLVSCLPITILGILHFYVWQWKAPCSAWMYAYMAHTLLLSNSAVNPWLCIALQENYKLHIRKIFNWTRQCFCIGSTKRSMKIQVYELGELSVKGKNERDSLVTYRETVNQN